jgi:hypothetical protein
MATTSTGAMYETVRTRLLTFVPVGFPDTLDTLLRRYVDANGVTQLAPIGKARLHPHYPSDTPVYPFGVLNFLPRFTDGAHHEEREAFDLELIFVHKPKSLFWELQALGDIADQAMKKWANTAGGFIGAKGRVRQTIPRPPAGSPADRDVIQELIRYPIIAWPQFLTAVA